MTKGAVYSYWSDNVEAPLVQKALFVRDSVNSPWLMVGIYEANHLKDIIATTYSNWPVGTICIKTLP